MRGLRALSRLHLLRQFSTFYPTPDKNKNIYNSKQTTQQKNQLHTCVLAAGRLTPVFEEANTKNELKSKKCNIGLKRSLLGVKAFKRSCTITLTWPLQQEKRGRDGKKRIK